MEYQNLHQSRMNLLLHLVAVPVFVLGVLTMLWSLAGADIRGAGYGLVMVSVSMAAQAWGHSREENQPPPGTGAWNLLNRIFTEQFYRFPRFVLMGEWLSNWRKA